MPFYTMATLIRAIYADAMLMIRRSLMLSAQRLCRYAIFAMLLLLLRCH